MKVITKIPTEEIAVITMIKEKKCAKCGELKALDKYYKDIRASHGVYARCKSCLVEYDRTKEGRDRLKVRREKYKATDKFKETKRKYNLTDKAKSLDKIRKAKWQKANPVKSRAHKKVRYALDSGKLDKPDNCQICGTDCIPNGHHEDYSKPLDVIWVCNQCHVDIHYKEEAARRV